MQNLRPRRVLQLLHRLLLDLSNALSGDHERSSDLFERVRSSVDKSISQKHDLRFSLGKAIQNLPNLSTQRSADSGVFWVFLRVIEP